MQTMVMTATGGADVLQLEDRPVPELRTATDIRVRLYAAGVNPVDTKLRRNGTYFPDRMPAVLGCDGAGVVESAGAGVQRFEPGDTVYFCHGGIGDHPGTYAEYAVLDERFAAPKPDTLDFARAAAAPLVLITAWESLHDRGRLGPDQTVLIHAGAGGVGHIAIQLAREAGAAICTTVSDETKARFATELGAERAILYPVEDFVVEALRWSGGDGVDLALDTVGGAVLERTFHAVRTYGDIVTILQPQPEVDWREARLRNLRVALELMLTPMARGLTDHQARQAGILETCARLIDDGRLTIHVAETFPLRQAAEAHRRLEQGSISGKLVLTMD